ncbi:MAG: HD-GYP domain-containing protein [Dehalococcoidia bacterium]
MLRRPPRRILLALASLTVLALAGTSVACALVPPRLDARLLVVAAQLVGLLYLARRYPVQLAPQTKTSVGTAPLYAAALLLPVSLAMLLTALTVTAAGLVQVSPRSGKRPPWFQVLFNAASTLLTVGASATVFILVSGTSRFTDVALGRWMLAAPLAAVTLYTGNMALVDVMVGLQLGRRPFFEFWRRWRFTLPQECALLLLGVLVATVATRQPLALGLMAVPCYVVYRSLRDGLALQVQTQEALLELAGIVDLRDHYTFEHSSRVAALARATAVQLGLSSADVETIYLAGRVHDVGKIGIKSTVLMKPGGLTEREWQEMRSHPELGARLVGKFPQFARGKELVLSHHERYDGQGYPRKLAGSQIPLGGRVLAVADAWDAMTSHRAYRQALDLARVYGELERGRGRQFDPTVVDAFLRALGAQPELAVPDTQETQASDVAPADLPRATRVPTAVT